VGWTYGAGALESAGEASAALYRSQASRLRDRFIAAGESGSAALA